MKVFLNSILIVCFLVCFTKNIRAQDSLQTDKMKNNCVKAGTTSLIKYFLSYEHAVDKHFSVGVMASYNATTFTGYTGTVFTRFYFSSFDKSGWFAEAKGCYAYFTTTAYSDYYYIYPNNNPDYGASPTLYGEHEEDVHYIYAGISGGYKAFLSKNIFFECLTGIHSGKATFGKQYVYTDNLAPSSIFVGEYNDVQSLFYSSGPGFPFHIMLNFGFAF